ncbi:hypothetical protein TNCV_1665071 [Trichonephila clavipes]|uniref:Uncharacterized protein n=1 Tax=Trichonephila clavipes TaxID=2585209 RepID=A0A8X6S4Q0_TRICX|nr:hypothetical protein TNCV_1665071 [Trichonephila clavipes]
MHVKYIETPSPLIGMLWKLGEEVPAQVSSLTLDCGSKLRGASPIRSWHSSSVKFIAEAANVQHFIDNVLRIWTATAGSDVVQSGRPIFDDFFQHLWPYIGNNTANVVFQMVKRLWLICIDQ